MFSLIVISKSSRSSNSGLLRAMFGLGARSSMLRPDADTCVTRATCDAAVGQQGQRVRTTRLTGEGTDILAGLHVPNPYRVVMQSAGQL